MNKAENKNLVRFFVWVGIGCVLMYVAFLFSVLFGAFGDTALKTSWASQANRTVGIPAAALAAFILVVIYPQAANRSETKLKLGPFELSAVASEIVLWILVFLSIVFALHVLDAKAAPPPADGTAGGEALAEPPITANAQPPMAPNVLNGIPQLAPLILAIIALVEFRLNTRQKSRANRHQQARAAQELLTALFAKPKARDAMRMLDWERNYEIEGISKLITGDDVRNALRIDDLEFDAKETFIRDCFDDLFDHIELIQHYIDIGYIHPGDVRVPLAYYTGILLEHADFIELFLKNYGYVNTLKFIHNTAQHKKPNPK